MYKAINIRFYLPFCDKKQFFERKRKKWEFVGENTKKTGKLGLFMYFFCFVFLFVGFVCLFFVFVFLLLYLRV